MKEFNIALTVFSHRRETIILGILYFQTIGKSSECIYNTDIPIPLKRKSIQTLIKFANFNLCWTLWVIKSI